MSILYKLTDKNGKTRAGKRNETSWIVGTTVEAKGSIKQDLCSDGWLHAYLHPLLACLLNPIHANFTSMRMFEVEGKIGMSDKQLKIGCRSLRVIKELTIPIITIEQRVKFAILCAIEVYQDESFQTWAKKWLNGENRANRAAAADAVAYAAAYAADAAAYAANAAAANAAAYAADYTADYAANAADYAANAAAYAAYAAANAAYAAANARFDLIAIAEKVMQE